MLRIKSFWFIIHNLNLYISIIYTNSEIHHFKYSHKQLKTDLLFSRGHATLHLAVSVGPSVGPSVRPSVRHISEFRPILAVLLLPNRPRLDCRVSGLVF